MAKTTNKGFITDLSGNYLLPITRGELVLDSKGLIALFSNEFIATEEHAGLMTAAEKAMLSGSNGGLSLVDLYTKLGYINAGLEFNNVPLNFYDAQGNATPIKIVSSEGNPINITVGTASAGTSNTVSIAINTLTAQEYTVSNILKSITVDKYGRVTNIFGSALTNAEIPNLSEKTISNSVLSNCITSDEAIGDNTKAIVNKAYVDSQIKNIAGIATGSLKFGGSIDSLAVAEGIVSNSLKLNYYYKVTKDFNLAQKYFDSTTSETPISIKIGDTLIVHSILTDESATKQVFVHIPSGDDITRITVTKDGSATNALNSQIGDVTLKFSSIFSVENNPSGSKTAYISMPAASTTQGGYLSKEDYTKFLTYAEKGAVSYSSIIGTSQPGVYTLGNLIVGNTEIPILGINNVSSLTIQNGSTEGNNLSYNPILRFTENGVDTDIIFTSGKGILVNKNGNSVEFRSTYTVDESSTNYLEITELDTFKVKIGSIQEGVVTNGLTSYLDFNDFKNKVSTSTTSFTIIKNSLSEQIDPSNNPYTYYYGSAAIVAAVTI